MALTLFCWFPTSPLVTHTAIQPKTNPPHTLRAVTKEDGTIVKEIEYSAYGEIIKDTNQTLNINIGFAGGLYDSDTKLTRFGYRDYDAKVRKWTAKDPIGFGGGDINLYGYVLGDPVNFIDPEGLTNLPIIGIGIVTGSYVFKLWEFSNNNKTGIEILKYCENILQQVNYTKQQVENSCNEDKDNLLNEIFVTEIQLQVECIKLINKYGGNKWVP